MEVELGGSGSCVTKDFVELFVLVGKSTAKVKENQTSQPNHCIVRTTLLSQFFASIAESFFKRKITATMRFASSTTVALLAGASCVESFSVQPSLTRVRQGASFSRGMAASSQTDFDSILGEGSSYREAANTIRTTRRSDSSSSPVIRVPDGSPAATVTLASSVAAADVFGDDLALEDEMAIDALMEEELANENPLMNNEILKRQHDKKVQKEEFKSAGGVMRYVKNPLLLVKGKDFSDITITIIIPAIASFYVLKKGAGIVQTKLTAKAQNLLHSCCDEIRYHTGDMELISRIYGDFKKKLWFHGAPSFIATEILTEFCAVYPAHQPITAASIE